MAKIQGGVYVQEKKAARCFKCDDGKVHQKIYERSKMMEEMSKEAMDSLSIKIMNLVIHEISGLVVEGIELAILFSLTEARLISYVSQLLEEKKAISLTFKNGEAARSGKDLAQAYIQIRNNVNKAFEKTIKDLHES